MDEWLYKFALESNRIEAIHGVNPDEVNALHHLVVQETIQIGDLVSYVSVIQPDAVLRGRPGLNVRVGTHVPPRGHKKMPQWLEGILAKARDHGDPWQVHCQYENLHPFTDGNGRSGRALWLWMMMRSPSAFQAMQLGFLHCFYYQTLSNHDDRKN